jgi:SAM-dependent methyltransferase
MRETLLDLLVAPGSFNALTLEHASRSNGEINAGILTDGDAHRFPITDGIPRFVRTDDSGQIQTADSFGFKWGRRDSYDDGAMAVTSRAWQLERYGVSSSQELRDVFASHELVLDAGCGSAFSSSLWLDEGWTGEWVGADISSAVDVARDRIGALPGTQFVQADVLDLPFADGTFGAVFTEGVLHHTPSTERAFHSVARLLRPGGELFAYIYRKKSAVREFTDDHVREQLTSLTPEEAWEALRPLTALGQALAELKADVVVPEDVSLLGIPAGTYDVQRLIYWHFAKLFWNPDWTFEENHHINFDWYHPTYAHRHTEAEIRQWCADAGLEVIRLHDEEPAAYTLRARRPR